MPSMTKQRKRETERQSVLLRHKQKLPLVWTFLKELSWQDSLLESL